MVVGDRTDTEDVEPEAPLTRRVLHEDGAGAFVEALFLDLRDGREGMPPSTPSSTAEANESSAAALLEQAWGDEGTKREGTGTGAIDGVSGPRTTLAQLVRLLGVGGRFGAGTGAREKREPRPRKHM